MAGYYSDLIYALAENAKPKQGHIVCRYDQNGKKIKDQSIFGVFTNLKGSRRIGVRLHSRRMEIRQATERLKEKLGDKLFQTGESLYGRWDKQDDSAFKFDIDLRITLDCATPEDAEGIAQRHWHPDLEPEDLFFTVFADELERHLERSLEEFDGTIDQRIAHYQNIWRKDLEQILSSRFGVRVELRFQVAVATVSSVVIVVGGGSDASLTVSFKDRLDHKLPLTATIAIEPLAVADASEGGQRFPQTEREQQSLLRGLISAAAQEKVRLFDYWFDQKEAENLFRTHLDQQLSKFGRSVSNVTLAPIKNPPLKDEKVEYQYKWKDSLDLILPIKATGHISIAENGAAIFDREGQPDRQDLFEVWLREETEKALAGKNIVDLDMSELPGFEADIKARLGKRAKVLGLVVEPFVTEPNLPFTNWLSSSFINIDEINADGTTGYKTSHETIVAEFTVRLEVVFKERAALSPFLRALEPFNNFPSLSLIEERLNNEVRAKLSQIVKNCASSVMETVPAENYFGYFAKSDDWNASISQFGIPGTDFDGGGGDSRITARIKELIKEQYPGIEIRNITYHRIDSCVKELRDFIGEFRIIDHEKVIKDPFDSSMDRKVELVIYIEGGNPQKTVEMLGKKIYNLTPGRYRAEIARGLSAILETSLSPELSEQEDLYHKLEILKDKLLIDDIIDPQVEDFRNRIKERIKETLSEQFGLMAGKIEILVKLPQAIKNVRKYTALAKSNKLQITEDKIVQLTKALKKKRKRLLKVDETTVEGRSERAELKKSIAEIEQELADTSAGASGIKQRSLPNQAHSVVNLLTAHVSDRSDLQNPPHDPEIMPSDSDESEDDNDGDSL